MAKVEIYTTPFCPFCTRAKALLDRKNADYEEIDLSRQQGRRAEMQKRAHGGRTVPQIFIDGEHIGGCDELHALDRKGGLDPMLTQ